MHKSDITIKNLTKLEGHADLEIKIRDKKVKDVKFKITENKRFFTQAIRGKPVVGLPQHVSRICGTCSIAHLICCIEAIEKTLGIRPTAQTVMLRKLAMYGLMIRDHALHLYIFALPDELGKDSILELNNSHHDLIHDAFHVKAVGNHLSILVAGRSVHAPYPVIGGFTHFPERVEIDKVIAELKDIRPIILRLIDLFSKTKFSFIRKTNFVALAAEEFGFLEGCIKSTQGYCIEEEDYFKHLKQVVIPYSEAIGYRFHEGDYMVGALARLNLNKDLLHEHTKRDAANYLKMFPSYNIFHNNLAQAIEILHSIDHALDLLEKYTFHKEDPEPIPARAGEGVGVVEAPRGTLYYRLKIDKNSIVKNGTIIVPTQQNQINMRNDIFDLVQQHINKPKHWIEHTCETLIRAYDPCMSCATHFLRVKWT